MDLFIVNLIVLLIIIFLLIVLSFVWPPDSPWAPWWRTSRKIARISCKLAKVTKKDIVYELGSGDASFIITASTEFGAKGIGIEIDPLRYFIANLRINTNKISDKIVIKRKNFYKEDLSSATVVFVYLVPKALLRLMPKFRKELRPNTRIISYKYKMNLPLIAQDKKNGVYVYKLLKK